MPEPARGAAGSPRVDVPSATLDRLKALYDAGRYVQAHALASPLGPLQAWAGVAARVFAGRLAGNLGAMRLGESLHLRVGREAPGDPLARYYFERALFGQRGAFAAWERVARWPALDDAPDWLRADWLGLEAGLFARLRDFERADRCMAQALQLAPERPWIHVELAFVHETADRWGDALAAAQDALALQPWYRPAVQAAAEALIQLGRDDDALALLTDAAARLESHLIVGRLLHLALELERHDDAARWLDRYEAVTPLAERRLREWVAGRRSDLALARGDRAAAIAAARQAGPGFYATVADRMARAAPDARRVRLDVSFVRQHHLTCAPATLTVMARYWGAPADHLQVADAICYDGTSSLKERDWAEGHGYRVREFRVTWDAARALLDRGIPFALTTFEPGSAHLQAIIGYDASRGTLLVRDPTDREHHELLADPGLERWQAQGPRGMCMVPAAEAHRLDGLALPDVALYDHFHVLQAALERHDRPAAEAAVAALEAATPGHRLTWHAHATLASWAGNRPDQLRATDRLRKLHPDDKTLALIRLGQMRDLYPRRARVEWVRDRCYGAHTHPGFWRQYAQELLDDGRTWGHAEHWLRRLLRHAAHDGVGWYLIANLWWRSRRHDAAAAAYHVAARLAEHDEDLARAHFIACRHLGRTGEALRFLEDRAARLGDKASGPACTLASAYRQLERMPEALRALEDGRARRPNDPVLDLELAEVRAGMGDADGARTLLDRARGRAWPVAVARTEAILAGHAGDPAAAGAAWRRVREWQPLALDALRGVAADVERTDGAAAGLDWLRARAREWPCHVGLRVHLAERLGRSAPVEALGMLREAAALDDADGWVRREIVDVLARLGRHDEALAESEVAKAVDPHSPAWHSIQGALLARRGQSAEARAAYEEAVRLSADTEYAVNALCGPDGFGEPDADGAARAARCRLVAGELARQHFVGDGVWAWARHAREALPADEMQAICERLFASRGEHWQVWSALAAQYRAGGQLDRARDVATRATERFAMLPRAWVDLAEVEAARGDRAAQIAALERARTLSPRWAEPIRKLGEALEAGGDFAGSAALFEAAIALDPDNPGHHGWLAEACWKLGQREKAVDTLLRAVALAPDYAWAWRNLDRWCDAVDARERAVAAARAATERAPREGTAWLWLARMLEGPLDERLAAAERAIDANPRDHEPHDFRAWLLGDARRWDEALAACRPAVFDGARPSELQGREGWVLGEQGRHAEAIAVLEPLVAASPDYYWAWQRLSDYREAAGDHAGALAAAEQLVRISPDSAVAHGYRGHAHRLHGNWDAACADFARAVELDGDYTYAGFALFDRQLETGDLDGAGAVLDRLCSGGEDQGKVARRVQLAGARGDRDGALAALERLFGECTPDGWSVEAAADAVAKADWVEPAGAVYARLAAVEGARADVGRAWVRTLTRAGAPEAARRAVEGLSAGSAPWKGAADAWLRHAGDDGPADALVAFVLRHGTALQDDVPLWGLAGWALTEQGRNRHAVSWLGDGNRAGAEPWMLLNLSLAHRCLGRAAAARAAGEAALRLPPDHSTNELRAWVACDRAADGDGAGARALLDACDVAALRPFHRFLHDVARAVGRAAGGRREAAAARRDLDAAWAGCADARALPEQRFAFRRAVAAVARASGPRAWLWSLRRRWRAR